MRAARWISGSPTAGLDAPFGDAFEQVLDARRREADEFYDAVCPYRREGGGDVEADLHRVQRQAFAGMLWCKQLYHLVAHRWLEGDLVPPSQAHRQNAMLRRWVHLYAKDVLSMPDAWEYPWFAAWDLAFHATTFAIIDPAFAKHQLELLVMEWYQHPDGQIPAYEWDFSNINPPVHAWAAWQVYDTEREIYGVGDTEFLDRVFAKLGLNFTWWVNEVDAQDNNIFEGGFLGMDNIRIIDRDAEGNPIEQADGSAWMAMFCLNMLRISLELAERHGGADDERAYRYNDAARKYLQHFMYICDAMNRIGMNGLWDDAQGFFMDCANHFGRLQVFSMVGLVPLFAVEEVHQRVRNPDSFYELYGFLRWFARNRRDLVADNAHLNLDGLIAQVSGRTAPSELRGSVAIVRPRQAGTHPRAHARPGPVPQPARHPRPVEVPPRPQRRGPGGSGRLKVFYEPAESILMKRMGGNSNWCGPVWMPVNYLLVGSLRKLHRMVAPASHRAVPHRDGGTPDARRGRRRSRAAAHRHLPARPRHRTTPLQRRHRAVRHRPPLHGPPAVPRVLPRWGP